MAKTPPRFPRRIDVWMPEHVADAIERVAGAQMLSISDVMRHAVASYLLSVGALPPMAPPNSQQPAEVDHAR